MNTLKEEMIKRVEELNEKLEEKEFHLEVKEAFKNNGNKFGITVLSDNNKYKMCPTVYKECMEDIWHDDDKVIEFLERIYEENKDKKLDVKTLCSRDYILENVRLRVVSDANIGEVKKMNIAYKHYLDMLILFYIDVSEASLADATASITLRKEELARAGIEQTELLNSAIRNIENDYVVSSMEKVICEILDIPVEEAPDMSGDVEMYVITNSHKIFGAASIQEYLMRYLILSVVILSFFHQAYMNVLLFLMERWNQKNLEKWLERLMTIKFHQKTDLHTMYTSIQKVS